MVKRQLDGAVDEPLAHQDILKSDMTVVTVHIFCEKSIGLHLAEPILTAGRLLRLAVQQMKFG